MDICEDTKLSYGCQLSKHRSTLTVTSKWKIPTQEQEHDEIGWNEIEKSVNIIVFQASTDRR